MDFIRIDHPVTLEWTILKGISREKEDFSRATLFVFLTSCQGQRILPVSIVDSVIKAEIPAYLPVGMYGVKAVWYKDGSRAKTCMSVKAELFCISDRLDDLQPAHAIKLTTNTATYGYDGLSAYEKAVMLGKTTLSEEEWVEAQNHLPEALEAVKEEFAQKVEDTKEEFAAELNTAKEEFTAELNTAKEEIGAVANEAKDAAESAVEAAESAVEAAESAVEAADEAAESATNAEDSAAKAEQHAKNVDDALKDIAESGDIPAATVAQVVKNTADIAGQGAKLSKLEKKVVSERYSFSYATTGGKRELAPHIDASMTITEIDGDVETITLEDAEGVSKTIKKTELPFVAKKEYVKISTYKNPSIEISIKYGRVSKLEEIEDKLVEIDNSIEEIVTEVPSKNIVDWSNLSKTSGKYYKGSTGAIGGGFSTGGSFGLVQVKPNTRYCLTVKGDKAISSREGLEVGIVFYSANSASINNYLGGVSANDKTFTTPEGCTYLGITYTNDRLELGEIMLNYGEVRGEYEEWHEPTKGIKIPDEYIVGSMVRDNSIPKSKIIGGDSSEAKIKVHLPKTIYAAEGDTLQIFHKSVMECANPYNYHIVVVCSVGKNFPRYYEFTPASDQLNKTYTLDFYVYDDNSNELAHETSTINVVSKSSITTSAKNILVIGDSVYSSGVISAEIYRRLHDTSGDGTPYSPVGWGNNNISMIGKLIASGVHQEARGGWSWSMYATNANKAKRFYVRGISTTPEEGATYTVQGLSQSSTYYFIVTERNITGSEGNMRCEVNGAYVYPTFPASGVLVRRSGTGDATIEFTSVEDESGNPFWNEGTNALDFTNYSNQYCSGASIDVLVSQLGINDIRSILDVDTRLETYIKPFIRKYHEQYPNGKFIIGSLPLQSPTGGLGSNNGANATYNFFQIQKRYFYYLDKIKEMVASEEFSSYVVLADTMAEFDSENNYPYTNNPVNNRVTETTERLGTNAQHPTEIGKLNLADSMFRAIVFALKV